MKAFRPYSSLFETIMKDASCHNSSAQYADENNVSKNTSKRIYHRLVNLMMQIHIAFESKVVEVP